MDWVEIDGSRGEGGGQILRTSLALSVITGKPVRFSNIRANRRKPGLRRQHLTCVRAARDISRAEISGDEINSQELEFKPGSVSPGKYHFSIGSAGSTSLVLQTILYPLLEADGPSEIVIEGGTHNPMAPTADFLSNTYFPVLEKMGPKVELALDRYGFYPAGGGRISIRINPAKLTPLELVDRGTAVHSRARAVISALAPSIGHREVRQAAKRMNLDQGDLEVIELDDPQGPGNVFSVELAFANVTETFTSFGEVAKRAEQVAGEAIRDARNYLKSTAPVGEYLADQLVIPFTLAGRGRMSVHQVSSHTRTNIETVSKFIDIEHDATSDEGVTLIQIVRK